MRNLTVKRNKAFAACAVSLRVYIEDPAGTDIVINDVPCRILGELKSGQEDTYIISDSEAKLYVIPEKSGNVYKDEYYQIPEGTDDISVSGKNVLETASGNPFRFDGVINDAIIRSRKRSKITSIIIIVAAVIVGIAIGLANTLLPVLDNATPKTFTVENMEITLTKGFKKYDHKDYDANYNSANVSVFVIKDSFETYPEIKNYTEEGYAELYLDFYTTDNLAQNVERKSADGLVYLSFEAEGEDGNTYHYYDFYFKSEDAFWIVEFAVETDKAETQLPDIIEWAKTVKFS